MESDTQQDEGMYHEERVCQQGLFSFFPLAFQAEYAVKRVPLDNDIDDLRKEINVMKVLISPEDCFFFLICYRQILSKRNATTRTSLNMKAVTTKEPKR